MCISTPHDCLCVCSMHVHMFMYMWVCVYICVSMCRGERLVLNVFLYCSPLYFFRQRLTQNLEHMDSIRLAAQQVPGIFMFCLPIVGIIDICYYSRLFWSFHICIQWNMTIYIHISLLLIFSSPQLSLLNSNCLSFHDPLSSTSVAHICIRSCH